MFSSTLTMLWCKSCYNPFNAGNMFSIERQRGMAQHDQEHHSGRSNKLKRRPLAHWVIFIVALLLLAVATVIWIISSKGSWTAILPIVIFSVLGVVIALFQWLFPTSSSTHEQIFSILQASQLFMPVPSNELVSQLLPATRKTSFRSMKGLPPPTDPRTILQRETVVREIYAELTMPRISAMVLTGIAGVGKSTLAALVYHYAEEQRHAGSGLFTTEAIWLNVDPAVTIDDLVGTLFENLGKPLPDVSDLPPQLQASALFSALNSIDKVQLVILDQFENLLDWETGRALADRPGIGEWLDAINSHPCSCRILLTSRPWPRGTREYPPTYMQEYYVEGLELSEGIDLLQKQGVGAKQATEIELHEAVARCDGHALALTLLASILRNNRSLNLTALLTNPIYARFWVGNIARNLLDYICTRQMSELERKLLLAFSVYREPVTLEAVQALTNISTDAEKIHMLHALNVLLAQHLLQALGEGRYQLHAIVAIYARDRFDESSELTNQQTLRSAHTRAAEYYQLQANIHCPPREKRQQSSDIHPLIEAIWQWCQAERWREAYNLIQQEGIFADLSRWEENATLVELCQLLLPLDKWQPERPQVMDIYNNLGVAYADLEKEEKARVYLELALSICGEMGDRGRESRILNKLGIIYADLGKQDEARENLEQALKIDKESGDRKREGMTLDNLGLIYYVLGKKEQALKCYEEALSIQRDIGDLEEQGTTLHSLGLVYNALGQKEQARENYEQALRIRREAGDSKGEAKTLRNLGVIYFDQTHYDLALASLLVAKQIFEEIQSPIRELTQSVIDTVHEKIGEDQFAALLAQIEPRASQILEQVLGEGA